MKIHRKKLKELYSILNNIELYEMPITSSFRFILTENLQILLTEINKIDSLMKEPPELTEYKMKQLEILKSLNISDRESLSTLSEEERILFEEKMAELNNQYIEVILNIDKLESFRKNFIDEEVDLPLKTIHIDKAPNLSVNTKNHWGVWNSIRILFHD